MRITQTTREVSVGTALGSDSLLFSSLVGSEQLGRLFEYRLELLSENYDIRIADIIGSTLVVKVNAPGGRKRYFSGLVTRFGCAGEEGNLAKYEAVLHPGLWLLNHNSNCRIFQDYTVTQIIKDVCSSPCYGDAVEVDFSMLSSDYPKISYCVQYRETDFDFVARLLEDAGIYFYFTHDASRHLMVLADSYSAHTPVAGYETCPFVSEGGAKAAFDEYVSSWCASGEVGADTYVLNDFDYKATAASLSGGLLTRANIPAAFGSTGLEIYDYPGKYDSAAVGTQISRARMESLHGQSEQIAARTNARGLCAGSLFSLFQHPRDDHNRSYLVTGTQHWITAGDYLSGDNNHTTFDCTLTAIGDKHPYRPPQSYAKPIVHGPQTATVVGKAGQEVWTDSFGRVKVQFHWDRAGMSDERSSCWVRVAQGWAGRGWGSQFLPRIGMEVVVSFLEGDPDRPLITGCVYNSSNEFPYELPANHSQSGVKSRSTLNSAGFNELRFEDKAGAEEVYMHAEKNFIREIKSDDIHTIGQDQKTSIARDQVATISRNQTMTVGEDQTMNVSGDQKVTVGNTIAITATTAIELKVGGSSIKIEPEKITIKSMTINIESTANTTIKGSIVDIN